RSPPRSRRRGRSSPWCLGRWRGCAWTSLLLRARPGNDARADEQHEGSECGGCKSSGHRELVPPPRFGGLITCEEADRGVCQLPTCRVERTRALVETAHAHLDLPSI